MPSRRRLVQTALSCLAVLGTALGTAGPAVADGRLESMFQDDNQLIFNTPEGTVKAMDTLKLLGVDRVRVSVFWRTVAPDAENATRPAFDATDPAAYPPGAFDRYDTLVRLARERNIAVNFNVTSPVPNWATGTPERPELDQTFDPSVKEFELFAQALGTRYSGTYRSASGELIQRVRYWSIWNEPNQAGWLTPQWSRDPRGKNAWVETAPVIYRGLVDAAWKGLQATGHGGDTILIGDTAPKGLKQVKGISRSIDALRFVRQLYCLDDNLQAYKGTSAQLRSCPVGDKALEQFPVQHPALFQATGYAHHPYELIFSPRTRPTAKDWVTIANLGDLERILRRIYQRYRQPIPKGARNVPVYLTEFGYQSNPPDPAGVSLAKQAAYNNESEYRAYRDRNVRTLSQFLLVDDKPITGVPKRDAFGSTFQTGLMTLAGKAKPAYAAYAFPIHLPSRRASRTGRLRIWGIPRPAPDGTRHTVAVERRGKPGTRYRRIGSLKTDRSRGYVFGTVKVTRNGAVRLAWRDATTGRTWRSRGVTYSVRKR